MTDGLRYITTKGYRYDQDRPVKEDARIIRSDIKALQAAGMLPADWKYSVRYRTGSMMRAVDITATAPRPTHLMADGFVRAGDRPRVVRVPTPMHARESVEDVWMMLRLAPGERHEIRWQDTRTPECHQVFTALDELHSAYNKRQTSNAPDDYCNVKFYGSVTIDVAEGVERYEYVKPDVLSPSDRVRGFGR